MHSSSEEDRRRTLEGVYQESLEVLSQVEEEDDGDEFMRELLSTAPPPPSPRAPCARPSNIILQPTTRQQQQHHQHATTTTTTTTKNRKMQAFLSDDFYRDNQATVDRIHHRVTGITDGGGEDCCVPLEQLPEYKAHRCVRRLRKNKRRLLHLPAALGCCALVAMAKPSAVSKPEPVPFSDNHRSRSTDTNVERSPLESNVPDKHSPPILPSDTRSDDNNNASIIAVSRNATKP